MFHFIFYSLTAQEVDELHLGRERQARKWKAAQRRSRRKLRLLSPKKCLIAVKRELQLHFALIASIKRARDEAPEAVQLLRPCSRMLQSQRAGRKQLSVMRWESPRDLVLLHRKRTSRVTPVPDATRSPPLHETGSSTSTSVMKSAGSSPASATTR